MDLESLRIFLKVAELGNLTRTAEQLGMNKSRVSRKVSDLEDQLGGRLFHRSTRVVRLTSDGAALLPRAQRMVREAEEIEAIFRTGQRLRGLVRVDLPVRLARNHVLPRLPELLDRHPELELFVSSTDRIVDPVREGFDCVLRVGDVEDSDLVQRKLGALSMVNCVGREYVERHGIPTFEELGSHSLIRYASSRSTDPPELEWEEDGELQSAPMRASLTVNNADAYGAACVAGLGIIQVPRIGVADLLESGVLVEVLLERRCPPMPVSLLHTHGRRAPRRVRAVMRWIADVLSPHLT